MADNKTDNRYPGANRYFEYLALILILLLGLYLRLHLVTTTQIDTPFRADARQYTAYAYNMRLHGVYANNIDSVVNPAITPKPDAVRSPGYPLFLYPFTRTNQLDRFAFNVFYLQAILSAATVAIVYFLGRGPLGPGGAVIAALLTAASPHLINLNIYLLTESLFTLAITLTMGALVFSKSRDRNAWWIISGILLAFAALVKPTVQYYILLFVGFVFAGTETDGKMRISLLVAIPFIAVFSVWLLRNFVTLGYLSDPALTIGTLHHGMYPQFMYNGQPHTFGFPYRFDPDSSTIAGSLASVITAIAHRFYTQPLEHLAWYLSKPIYLFRWEMIQGVGTFIYPVLDSPYDASWPFIFINASMRAVHPVVVGLSMVGAAIAWLPHRLGAISRQHGFTIRLLSLTYAYFILVHIAAAPFPRYSIPLRPLTYILAVLPVCLAVTALRKKSAAPKNLATLSEESR